ncbi:MAG: NAD(P)-binding domain-containing protein [Rhodospirillaceae bacterium]
MDQFALIGASYKSAGVDRIGQLAWPKGEIEERLRALAARLGVPELAYIGTCNRIEFVLAGDDGLAVQACRDALGEVFAGALENADVRQVFRAWTGEGAAEHLFLVAAGLDSAQAGEREIYNQVRQAWSIAKSAGTCGAQLDYLFAEALRAAQDVHKEIAGAVNVESLADYAVKRALEHVDGARGRVALVGISPMTRTAGRALAAQGLPVTVVNRTFETAQELAAELHGAARPLDQFLTEPGAIDVVITAVGGAEPVIDLTVAARIAAAAPESGTLVVDLGVPPNVDPAAGLIAGLTRLGMDAVITDAALGRSERLRELASARLVIDDHLERLRGEYAIREASSLIQDLTMQYQRAAVESLRRLPKSDATEEGLRRWAEAFARRLAHAPLKGLRALATESGPAAVQAYLRGVQDALHGESARHPLNKEKT